ncbi:HDOD domain-containing protein [Spongiibacter sp.]|uniref:HDOD domain-containing protein n=1 Tax=Spongiibacter sp. TaxID=2024860 RepID=UPI00356533AC
MLDAKSLVAEVSSLISFPSVAIEINRLLNSEKSTVSEIAAVIESDPALTAKLLKVANSALVQGRGEIDSVGKAVNRIGSRMVNELVMGIEVARCFEGLDNDLISVEDFWRHSLQCATICQQLAALTGARDSGAAFTAGLLHDIGQLIMYSTLGEQIEDCLTDFMGNGRIKSTYHAEQQFFGFDHCNVGLELAIQWQLPLSLQQCIYAHHQPSRLPAAADIVHIVHLGNLLAQYHEQCQGGDQTETETAAALKASDSWRRLQLSPECANNIIIDAQDTTELLLGNFVKTQAA